ncbi:hypothetical protein [Pararobbsia alpina]|uniref:hypothetical protein n=1 Tax=Pararobbsia alpina TaxID=621374 RepID=UPI001583ED83|nr:hypothetical protein [Pararobbsia alpina]
MNTIDTADTVGIDFNATILDLARVNRGPRILSPRKTHARLKQKVRTAPRPDC